MIAKAPKEYFWAGVGDGISKAPEVEHAVAAAVERGVELPHTAVLGAAIAASSKDAFYKYGEQGIKDVENRTVSRAIEEIALDILVSTGYASNLVNQDDFYYNSCHAHAFYNATTAIKKEKEPLHGQVVKCLTIVRQSLAIVRCFFRMTKYTQKFKLDLIQEYLDTGCSQRWIENKYSLPKDTLKKWWTVYNLKGPEGLKLRHFKRKFTVDFKLRVINYYLNNDVSMSKVAASHNLLCSQISIWLKLFMEGGSEALKPKKKGRPSKMSKMTKKDARKILKKESDEIAALKSELRQVKMERDILKKSLTLFGPSKPRRKQ